MEDRSEILARRARKLRAHGEFRKAANAYGELTSLEPERASWWVLMAVMLRGVRRDDAADKALRQAVYLLHRTGESAREHVVRRLLARDGQPLAA